jgi:hypothetical protein
MAQAWAKRPRAGRFRRVANLTARIVVARHDHPHKLKMVSSKRIKEDRHDPLKDTESSPVLFRPSVPLCAGVQQFGTIVSLAAVWIVTAHSVAQAMVA